MGIALGIFAWIILSLVAALVVGICMSQPESE
jgi:hypothetical protein